MQTDKPNYYLFFFFFLIWEPNPVEVGLVFFFFILGKSSVTDERMA